MRLVLDWIWETFMTKDWWYRLVVCSKLEAMARAGWLFTCYKWSWSMSMSNSVKLHSDFGSYQNVKESKNVKNSIKYMEETTTTWGRWADRECVSWQQIWLARSARWPPRDGCFFNAKNEPFIQLWSFGSWILVGSGALHCCVCWFINLPHNI